MTPPPPADPPSEMPVTVRTGPGGYRSEIRADGHLLVADEPKGLGGGGTGPTPYALLLAGLGACTGMTVRMYADRKGWPLQEVVVRLRHGRNHGADCENCEAADARLERVDREIELVGPLDAEQRARLLQIANQCPMHRTIGSGFRVETTLLEGAEITG